MVEIGLVSVGEVITLKNITTTEIPLLLKPVLQRNPVIRCGQ